MRRVRGKYAAPQDRWIAAAPRARCARRNGGRKACQETGKTICSCGAGALRAWNGRTESVPRNGKDDFGCAAGVNVNP